MLLKYLYIYRFLPMLSVGRREFFFYFIDTFHTYSLFSEVNVCVCTLLEAVTLVWWNLFKEL